MKARESVIDEVLAPFAFVGMLLAIFWRALRVPGETVFKFSCLGGRGGLNL